MQAAPCTIQVVALDGVIEDKPGSWALQERKKNLHGTHS